MGTPQSFDDYPKIMDSAQVAEMLRSSQRNTVREMAREGRIPVHRDPGARTWWFDRDEPIEWMKGHVVEGPWFSR
jgi:excisionase family DNA binding protein